MKDHSDSGHFNLMNKHEMQPTAAPVPNDWGSRSHVQTLMLMVATALGIYLCYRLALPFLSALVWALALAVVFSRAHQWLESKLKRRNLAAAVSVLVVSLVVLGLATFVGQRLVQEAVNGAELIKTKVESGEWRHALEAHPRLAPLADWMERQNLPGTLKTVAIWMTTTGASFVKGSVVEVIGLLLTFYLLFFFLRDRRAALQALRFLSPLSEVEMDRLLGRVGDTIVATVYGTLAVAAVQGLLGGLMFWWLGLPAPLLWGVVMALLAVVPVLGAFVVWIPAALFLALDGSWGKALILAMWGTLVVSTVDNLLRPILVGNRLKLHTVHAFISMVGGVILFGSAGLILGPVILTITMVLLETWRRRTATEETATKGVAAPAVENTGEVLKKTGGAVAFILTATLLVSGCQSFSVNDRRVPQPTVTPGAPSRVWAVPIEKPGLPNLRRVSDDLYGGGQPTVEGFRQLQAMGVKTVINLRVSHNDRENIAGTGLAYEEIPMNAWHTEDEDVVRFLELVADRNHAPFFVYCHYGADRSGLLGAVYRIVIQGWTKDEASAEMTQGGFGFHGIWANLVDYLRTLDVEKLKRQIRD